MVKSIQKKLANQSCRSSNTWRQSTRQTVGLIRLLLLLRHCVRDYPVPTLSDSLKDLATNFITDINTRNIQTMGKQFGSFGIDIMTNNKQVTDFLQASIAENVQLITSIQSQYLDRVETLVLTNMRAGLRPSAIQQQLQDQFSITKNRAKMIARDQTSKAN